MAVANVAIGVGFSCWKVFGSQWHAGLQARECMHAYAQVRCQNYIFDRTVQSTRSQCWRLRATAQPQSNLAEKHISSVLSACSANHMLIHEYQYMLMACLLSGALKLTKWPAPSWYLVVHGSLACSHRCLRLRACKRCGHWHVLDLPQICRFLEMTWSI